MGLLLLISLFFSATTYKEIFERNVLVNYSLTRTKLEQNFMREYEKNITTNNNNSENNIALSIATLIITWTSTLASLMKSTSCHFLNFWKPWPSSRFNWISPSGKTSRVAHLSSLSGSLDQTFTNILLKIIVFFFFMYISEYFPLRFPVLAEQKCLQSSRRRDWLWLTRDKVTDVLDLSWYEDRQSAQIYCHQQAGRLSPLPDRW